MHYCLAEFSVISFLLFELKCWPAGHSVRNQQICVQKGREHFVPQLFGKLGAVEKNVIVLVKAQCFISARNEA